MTYTELNDIMVLLEREQEHLKKSKAELDIALEFVNDELARYRELKANELLKETISGEVY